MTKPELITSPDNGGLAYRLIQNEGSGGVLSMIVELLRNGGAIVAGTVGVPITVGKVGEILAQSQSSLQAGAATSAQVSGIINAANDQTFGISSDISKKSIATNDTTFQQAA